MNSGPKRAIASLVVCALGAASPLTGARALDRQGSAHGGSSEVATEGVAVSGTLSLGASLFNPTYAARPDNTGLALMRYAGHLDLDLVGARLSIPLDLNFLSNRLARSAGQKLAPSEFDVITGVTSTNRLGPGALEVGVRVERDMPTRGGYTQTYVDARARYLYSLATSVPHLRDALHGGDVRGFVTLGGFAFNPSYAARPDNSGLALLRYGAHLETSTLDEHLSVGLDAAMFTDRRAMPLRPSELDFTVSVTAHVAPFDLQVAYERDMPVDRGGLVQHFVYALATFGFASRRHDHGDPAATEDPGTDTAIAPDEPAEVPQSRDAGTSSE